MFAMNSAQVLFYKDLAPKIASGVFIASGAQVIGDVELGEYTSIWFNTVIRGDEHWVKIGSRTNIQDNAVVHVTRGTAPTKIGSDVTVGHGAIIHGCTIDDLCLIGMGAIILDGAHIQKECLVAAGSLVPPGKTYPPRSLIKGSPAVVTKTLNDQDIATLLLSAQQYREKAQNYMGTRQL